MTADTHTVSFYGLSTCIHCRHAREFLDKHQVTYDLTYVDELEGEERNAMLMKVREYNPAISFPTILIDSKTVIVGFQAEALTKALGL
ncbi:glutaredoxin [Desulfovibrio sp. OttesenSCG-928-A18]|nr:glutaredoxin [Desulfovibrio sp. OttesenSCG-928-A18]